MSIIRELGNLRVDLLKTPFWAKLVMFCCLGAFCFLGSMNFYWESRAYSSPSVPNVSTQQIYPLHVWHGHLRFVTANEVERFNFWKDASMRLIGIPVIGLFIVLFVFREKSN